jgi:hypothetical protein
MEMSSKKLLPHEEAYEVDRILSFLKKNLVLYANFLGGPLIQRKKRLIAFWKAINILAMSRSPLT